MVTCPPPYSPAAMSPANDAYSSGWSSVGTASRFRPCDVGGPLGTAQLFRTPSRSSRRSQCTRSPVRPRGVWCSWTTKVSSFPTGSALPAAGTGSTVFAGSRLARYSASGSSRRPGTSGAAAGALGRRLVGGRLLRRGLLRRGLLGRSLLRGRLLGGCLRGRRLLRGRLLRRGLRLVVGGRVGVVVRDLVGGAAPGALDAPAQRTHEI